MKLKSLARRRIVDTRLTNSLQAVPPIGVQHSRTSESPGPQTRNRKLINSTLTSNRFHCSAPSSFNTTSHPIADMSVTAPARLMTRSCQLVARQQYSLSSQCLRISSQQSSQRQRRWQSTDAAAQPTNPKISTIVDQISGLTLLETADLVASLKV